MVDMGTYVSTCLNTGKITPEEYLPMIVSKNYMSQNMYVLLLNDYV